MPSTQPAAQFAADSPARTWFAQLASMDDAKRDDARTGLMGLTRDDLPSLRALVDESRPLAAAQVAALHEIVLQLFLSGEPYENSGKRRGLASARTRRLCPNSRPMYRQRFSRKSAIANL